MAEIFFYLLEHFPGINQCPDTPTLAKRLAYEGFDEHEVRAAIAWIELLREPLDTLFVHTPNSSSIRHYHALEYTHIGADNLNLMLQICDSAQMPINTRERMVERCMMLPIIPQDLEHFKALLLTILWAEDQDISVNLLHSVMSQYEHVETCH